METYRSEFELAEFFKENEKRRESKRKWLENYDSSFKNALARIGRHQERKILTSQVILLTILGALLVNLLTASLYNLIVNLGLEPLFITTQLDFLISLISGTLLVAIFLLIKQQLSKYAPLQPTLVLMVKLEDTKDFVEPAQYKKIVKYLEDGKLQDFRGFGKTFFSSLEGWFAHLFNPEVPKKPIRESERTDNILFNQYPTIIKEYDISEMSRTGVKINLEVILVPDVVFGDKTAPYAFYVVFRFKILNPEHCYADDFLEEYYYLYASRVVAITSYSVSFAFSKLIPNFFGFKRTKKPN